VKNKDVVDTLVWGCLLVLVFSVVLGFSVFVARIWVNDGRYWAGRVNMDKAVEKHSADWRGDEV
jgi:hypothetical protein